jgi:hypothetical protein
MEESATVNLSQEGVIERFCVYLVERLVRSFMALGGSAGIE